MQYISDEKPPPECIDTAPQSHGRHLGLANEHVAHLEVAKKMPLKPLALTKATRRDKSLIWVVTYLGS